MVRIAVAAAATLFIVLGGGMVSPAAAQTCEATAFSCTEMNQRCMQRCNRTGNTARSPDTCIQQQCVPAERQCKATGRWSNTFGCFTTGKRS
jgi:hypothetical protein